LKTQPNHFADENYLNKLNQLIKTQEFSEIIQKIKKENQLELIVADDRNLILSVLEELKHPKFQIMQMHFQNYRKFSNISEPEKAEEPENQENTGKIEKELNNSNVTHPPKDDTLEKALQELHNLVGLEKVKKDINELINLLEIQKKRNVEGLKNVKISLHTVFLGPPGTGKTSVARLLSRILKHLGYLSEGQLYETDREGLIAGYVGQTAIKTDKAVNESVRGVLFIDEAYALTQNAFGNDFGSEAVNTIIKRMEDYRDNIAVVVAGYTEPMQVFIDSNPGLRSRFNRYFYFEHFTNEQLLQIFENFCSQFDFTISEEAKEKLKQIFSSMDELKTESFGNARVVRNIFERSVQNQANRLIHWTTLKDEFFKTLHFEDIPGLQDIMDSLGNKQTEEENL
jgi:stage V sporulation protein K